MEADTIDPQLGEAPRHSFRLFVAGEIRRSNEIHAVQANTASIICEMAVLHPDAPVLPCRRNQQGTHVHEGSKLAKGRNEREHVRLG